MLTTNNGRPQCFFKGIYWKKFQDTTQCRQLPFVRYSQCQIVHVKYSYVFSAVFDSQVFAIWPTECSVLAWFLHSERWAQFMSLERHVPLSDTRRNVELHTTQWEIYTKSWQMIVPFPISNIFFNKTHSSKP